MKNLVIDTDVGTDVDDMFALVYALRTGNIKAISTVHGNTEIRARIARKLEKILGISVPVTPGMSCSDESIRKYWTGLEGKALTPEELKKPLIKTDFPEYGQDTKLVCIGPLTNIAYQLKHNPSIKQVKDIYVVGSSDSSHNFEADLEAFRTVFSESWRIWQITKQVSLKIAFTRPELERMRVNELGNLLADSASRWLDYTKKETAPMYDVLAVSAALGEDYVKFKQEGNRFLSIDVDPELKNKLMEKIKNGM